MTEYFSTLGFVLLVVGILGIIILVGHEAIVRNDKYDAVESGCFVVFAVIVGLILMGLSYAAQHLQWIN